MEMKCEQCSKSFAARKAEVNRGNGRFCSLSCASIDRNMRRPKHGKIKLSYAEQKERYGKRLSVTNIVGRVQGRCRERKEPCDLTPCLFRSLLEAQNNRCYYSGREMTLGNSTRHYQDMDQASVDRVVPDKGYTEGNMVLCCRWANTAKGQDDMSQLLQRVRDMVEYQA